MSASAPGRDLGLGIGAITESALATLTQIAASARERTNTARISPGGFAATDALSEHQCRPVHHKRDRRVKRLFGQCVHEEALTVRAHIARAAYRSNPKLK